MVKQCYLCKKIDYLNHKLSYHRFPKDANRRAEWLRRLGFEDNGNLPKHAVVCSDHFDQDSIMVKPSGLKVLKSAVVPLEFEHPVSQPRNKSDGIPLHLSIKTERESGASDDNHSVDNQSSVKITLHDVGDICGLKSEGGNEIDSPTLTRRTPILHKPISDIKLSPVTVFESQEQQFPFIKKPEQIKIEHIELSESPSSTMFMSGPEEKSSVPKNYNEEKTIQETCVGPSSSSTGNFEFVNIPRKRKRRHIGNISSNYLKVKANYRKMKAVVAKQKKTIKILRNTVKTLRETITTLNSLLEV